MHLLLRWILSAVALYITVLLGHYINLRYPDTGLRFWIAPGLAGVSGALLFVLALGVANALLRPVLKALHEGGRAAAVSFLEAVEAEIRAALLLTGSRDLAAFRRSPKVVVGELGQWLKALAP